MLSGLGFLSMRLSFVFKLGLAVTALVVLLTALMFALGKNRMHAARTVSAAESNGRRLPPLVLWAWNPGLRPDGTMRTLPPLTHAEFVAATRRWVEAGTPCPPGK